jgi:serine phosphatase RsbU (regulator of sigma subunit)
MIIYYPLRYFSFHIIGSILLLFFLVPVHAQDHKIDSLKAALKVVKQDTSRCRALAVLAETTDEGEWQIYNKQLKEITLEKLKTLKESDPLFRFYKRHLAMAVNNEAYELQNIGDYDKAVEVMKEAIKIQESIGDKAGAASSINNLGAIQQRRNNFIEAMAIFEKGQKINTEIKNWRGVAFCLNQIGSILLGQGNIAGGIAYYEKALKISEQNHIKESEGASLYNIAFALYNQNEIAKAKEYALRSLEIREGTNEKNDLSFALTLMGRIYVKEGKFKEGIEYFEQGLKLRKEIGDHRSIGMSYQSIGNALKAMKDFEGAITNYEEALKYTRGNKDKLGSAFSLINIGDIAYEQGNKSKALTCYTEVFNTAKELGNAALLSDVTKHLHKLYSSQGDYKKAYEYYNFHIVMRDSINNQENKKAIIRSQFAVEYAKKEQDMKNEQEKKELLYEQEKIKKQADLEKQKAISYSFMVGAALLLALIFVVFLNLKQSKSKNKIIVEQKKAVEAQKELIEEKQKEIVDSINYAKRIQYTLLAHEEFLQNNIKEHFVLFKPKDIVSGDFYWATKKDNNFYLAVCDSTGHGVPGAFMSLLNISFLNEAINERNISQPNEIFNYVRKRLIEEIGKEEQKDGFDGVLICMNQHTGKLTYAAANNKPVLISGTELSELSSDKMPVGVGERKEDFRLFSVDAEKGSTLYLCTDGYADQFGGPKGKKFKYKQLNELILSNSDKPLKEQKGILHTSFETWRGSLEQVDDVCIIGIHFR